MKLSKDEEQLLIKQQSRGLVSNFLQDKLEKECGKNWDKFYKRNETRFFKDRHWTTREFVELVEDMNNKTLLEIGCGVGNFFYPLLEEGLKININACDISQRAVDFVKKNPLYDKSKINAFVFDVTKDELTDVIEHASIDLISLVFVLSAILPAKFEYVFRNVYNVLKPGGLLLFRDYAVNDRAMIRFGPGCKMAERLYMRQDGTRAYYFTSEELGVILTKIGFELVQNEYIGRRTVNKKEGVDCKRIFLQIKCRKPIS